MKRDETCFPLQQKGKDKQLEEVKEHETVQGEETARLRPKFLGVKYTKFHFRKKYLWIHRYKVTHQNYQLRKEKSINIPCVPLVILPWGQII